MTVNRCTETAKGNQVKDYCYAAMREGEPGAYAICADMKDMPEETACFVSQRVKEGASVIRVDAATATEMLNRWIGWKHSQKSAERRLSDSDLIA